MPRYSAYAATCAGLGFIDDGAAEEGSSSAAAAAAAAAAVAAEVGGLFSIPTCVGECGDGSEVSEELRHTPGAYTRPVFGLTLTLSVGHVWAVEGL